MCPHEHGHVYEDLMTQLITTELIPSTKMKIPRRTPNNSLLDMVLIYI